MKTLRITAVLALSLALGACSSEEPTTDKGESPKTGVATPAPEDNLAHDDGTSTLLYASWGSVSDEEPEQLAPPHPTVVTPRKGRQQKFEREAAKRWKNTEIFVVR